MILVCVDVSVFGIFKAYEGDPVCDTTDRTTFQFVSLL